MTKIECFKIQLIEIKNGIAQSCHQIKNDRSSFSQNPTIIVADPFLFVNHDTLYLFYEQKSYGHSGIIMMKKTEDLIHWSEPVEVLCEPFHLSYPWVFEDSGRVYMIPETGGDKSIRLYEAEDSDLTSWKFVKKLIEQNKNEDLEISFSDSSIVMRDGIYYLFTTVRSGGVNRLRLFYAHDLMGLYNEHPKSPICISNKYGRDAGSIIEYKGELFRPAQDCEYGYGDNVHIMKITELTPSEYAEAVVKENIFNIGKGFYRYGGHQFNIVKYRGRTVIATDAKEYHWFIVGRLVCKLFAKIRPQNQAERNE